MCYPSPRIRRFRLRLAPAAGVLLGLAGCQLFHHRAPAPPPSPPTLDTRVDAFLGSPLSGPTGSAVPSIIPSDALEVKLDWYVIDQTFSNELLPLDAQARLMSAPLAGGAVLPVGQATRMIRFGTGAPVDEFAATWMNPNDVHSPLAATQTGLLAPGSALRFQCRLPPRAGCPPALLTITVGRAIGARMPDHIAISASGLAVQAAEPGRSTASETAFIDTVQMIDGSHFALILPQEFDGLPWKTLVANVIVTKLPDDANATSRVDALTKELSESVARVRGEQTIAPVGSQPTLQSALAALGSIKPPRTTLLFLATSTNAPIAADFILSADDPLLAPLRDRLLQFESAQSGAPTPARVGWFMEQTSLQIMIEQAGKGTLAPELSTVLVVHAGEVGRNPDSLGEVVKRVGNSSDLTQRLIAENFVFLEDSAAASRVRAFDWLKALGKAPANYDPLGDAKARRDAITRSLDPDGGKP